MFLTKVVPSKGFVLSRLAQKANGGDAYAQHQLLWQLFPDQEERDFLFRYEQGREGPTYYVLSHAEPVADVEGVQVCTKPFHPKLKEGDRLAYTLRANPTRMLKSGVAGKRGQRVDVLMHAKYQARERSDADMALIQQQAAQEWLMDTGRQARMGVKFDPPPEVTEHQQHQVYKPRPSKGGSKPIRFTSVNYQGILTVTDPERFLKQLGEGVGRAKALGCGLMMIRPCR